MTFNTQPFTIEQVLQLDLPVITTEIARLQNSLVHLRETQQQLQKSMNSESRPDPVFVKAFEENKVVISSQEERISMLRFALEHKGFQSHTNLHYELQRPSEPRPGRDNDGVFL